MSGRHLRFPFRLGPDGRPEAPRDLPDHVRGEVIQLLLTNPGERDFQPNFGGGLKRMVFEANDDVTAALAQSRITQGLSFWLGERLEVRQVEARAQDSVLAIDIAYLVLGETEVRRLRFEHNIGAVGSG